jgi:DNA topoisomerase II
MRFAIFNPAMYSNHMFLYRYEIFLEKMSISSDKTAAEIEDFTENHTDTTVSFTVKTTKENIDKWEKDKDGLLGHFKLKGSLSTSCMYLFDQEGRITKYETPEEIISAFYDVRLEFYGKRKALLVDKLQTEQRKLSNKARFVEEVCSGDLIVSNRKRSAILAELQQRGYETFVPVAKDANNSDDEEDEAESKLSDADLAKGYEYLLGMKIWSLTFEKAEELRLQLADKTKQLQELEATAPTQMWLRDLDAIEVALDERHALMVEAAENEQKAQKKGAAHRVAQGKKKKTAATKQAKKKKAGEWDSDMETSDEEEKMPARKPVAARKPAVAKKALKVVAASKAPADPSPVEETASRLSQSLHVSPPPKKAGTAKRTSSPVLDSDLSEVEVIEKQPIAKKKSTITQPKKKSSSFDESDDDSDAMNFSEEESTAPVARKAAAVTKKQPVARKNTLALPKKKKPSFDESDDDDSDAMNFSDEEPASAPAAAPVARPARRARPTKTYVESSGSESDDYEASDDE